MQDLDIHLFYKDAVGLSDTELIQFLVANSNICHIQKGDTIHSLGDPVRHIHFLVEGLLRGYIFDVNGREITDCFAFLPGAPLVPCLDLTVQSPVCIETVEALEESTLILVPFNIISKLLKENLTVLTIYNKMLSASLKDHWENEVMLSRYTAADRYLWFLERFPGLIDRVSHQHIASFLGITPVQLSRIRRAIRDQKR